MSNEIEKIFQDDFEAPCDMCGVCCTYVGIRSKLPDGTLFDKPCGVRCKHVGDDNRCSVWGDEAQQPVVCISIKPLNSLCRFDLRHDPDGKAQHIMYLQEIESLTAPQRSLD